MRASKRTIVGVLALSAGTVCGIAIAGGSAFSATYGKGRAHAMRYEPPANIEAPVDPVESPPVEATDGPIVQLALLLDTSNSMDGLIDQAKARLWSIVNEMSKASHDGRPAQIRVALYEYGNDGVPSAVGHVRQRTPFTTDLDILSEQLFSLRTDGGSEYCGWVVGDAVTELDWLFQGDAPRDVRRSTLEGQTEAALDRAIDGRHAPGSHPAPVVRIIVIAGNEPFTQGTVPHTETIAQARARGITVNTIFCGPRAEGEATGWSRGAELGGGRYANIDPDTRDWAIPTPYDGDLEALNTKLNTTYLPYGEDGHRFAFRQGQADRLAPHLRRQRRVIQLRDIEVFASRGIDKIPGRVLVSLARLGLDALVERSDPTVLPIGLPLAEGES
ncbi:MAG: vWA domain-containing protein, partial [Planctomycetota bacterium]